MFMPVDTDGGGTQTAGQPGAEYPEMVCDRRDRADEPGPGLVRQGLSHSRKADSGDESKATGKEQPGLAAPCVCGRNQNPASRQNPAGGQPVRPAVAGLLRG